MSALVIWITAGIAGGLIGFSIGYSQGIRKGFGDGVQFMKEFLRACQKDGKASRRGP